MVSSWRSGAVLALLLLLAKAMGLVRDGVIAHQFGAGHALGIYIIAASVPLLAIHIFLGAALTSAIIPQIIQLEAQTSTYSKPHNPLHPALCAYITQVGLSLGIIGVVWSISAQWLAPIWVAWLGPGLDAAQQAEATRLVAIIVWSIPAHVVATIIAAALQALGSFGITGFRHVIQTSSVALAAIIWAPTYGNQALAWGFVAGSCCQVWVQLPALLKLGYIPRRSLKTHPIAWRELALAYAPLGVCHLLLQALTLLDRRYSSWAGADQAATYAFAERLVDVCRALVSASVAVVVFPQLSRLLGSHPPQKSRAMQLTADALIGVVVLTTPAALTLLFFGQAWIAWLLQRGAFGDPQSMAVAHALLGLAPATVLFACFCVLERTLVAQKRLWPLAAILAVGCGIGWAIKAYGVVSHGLIAVGAGTVISMLWTTLASLILVAAHEPTSRSAIVRVIQATCVVWIFDGLLFVAAAKLASQSTAFWLPLAASIGATLLSFALLALCPNPARPILQHAWRSFFKRTLKTEGSS